MIIRKREMEEMVLFGGNLERLVERGGLYGV